MKFHISPLLSCVLCKSVQDHPYDNLNLSAVGTISQSVTVLSFAGVHTEFSAHASLAPSCTRCVICLRRDPCLNLSTAG